VAQLIITVQLPGPLIKGPFLDVLPSCRSSSYHYSAVHLPWSPEKGHTAGYLQDAADEPDERFVYETK
jgi:hypothetical protein